MRGIQCACEMAGYAFGKEEGREDEEQAVGIGLMKNKT